MTRNQRDWLLTAVVVLFWAAFWFTIGMWVAS